jgi:phosphoribosylglycinamide formyltransferase-1
MASPMPIAVLISGGGTTLRNLIEKVRDGSLPAEIRLVTSSSADARGLQFAAEAGIRSLVVPKAKTTSAEQYSEAIFGPCRAAGVQIVAMGGFLKHVVIPADFENRVVNIHPSLIPAFCGQGMYGLRVHQAVLDYGAKITGCTVHFVDNDYDRGPIILQRAIEVHDNDTPASLQGRVVAEERRAYPEALSLLAAGRVQVSGRRVEIR